MSHASCCCSGSGEPTSPGSYHTGCSQSGCSGCTTMTNLTAPGNSSGGSIAPAPMQPSSAPVKYEVGRVEVTRGAPGSSRRATLTGFSLLGVRGLRPGHRRSLRNASRRRVLARGLFGLLHLSRPPRPFVLHESRQSLLSPRLRQVTHFSMEIFRKRCDCSSG